MKRKSESTVGSILGGAFLILIGIVWMITHITDMGAFGKTIDLNSNLRNDTKVGTRVSVSVDADFGCFATLEHRTNGIKTGEDAYYLVCLYDENDPEMSDVYMSLKVKKKADKETLDSICDATFEYLNGTSQKLANPVIFEGVLKEMESQEKSYFKSWMSDMGADESDMEQYCRYFTIDTTVTKGTAIFDICIMLLLIAIGVGVIISTIKAKNKKNQLVQAMADGANPYINGPNPYANASNQGDTNVNPYVDNTNPYMNSDFNPYNASAQAEETGDKAQNSDMISTSGYNLTGDISNTESSGGYTLNGEKVDNNNNF